MNSNGLVLLTMTDGPFWALVIISLVFCVLRKWCRNQHNLQVAVLETT